MSNQYNHRQETDRKTAGPKAIGPKAIGRRQLLSTLALGSTALVGMVSLKKGTSVLGTSVTDTSVLGTGSHGSSIHDKLFSPAAAQEASTVTLIPGHDFTLNSDGGITGYSRSAPTTDGVTYWREGEGMFVEKTVAATADQPANVVSPYFFEQNQIVAGPDIAGTDDDFTPKEVRPLTSADNSFVAYPVVAVTSDSTARRVFVGFYAKSRSYDGDWQFIPTSLGLPQGANLRVFLALENPNGQEIVVSHTLGDVGDALGGVTLGSTRSVNGNGDFLVDDPESREKKRKGFSDALDAREFGIDGGSPMVNPLMRYLGLAEVTERPPPPTVTTPEAAATTIGAVDTTMGAVATTTVGAAATTMGAVATTPEAVATTPEAVATTPEAVATTMGIATTTPEAVATTMGAVATTPEAAATTVGVIATTVQVIATTAAPAIPNSVPFARISNFQAESGADIARSLKNRLSIFRGRNRFE